MALITAHTKHFSPSKSPKKPSTAISQAGIGIGQAGIGIGMAGFHICQAGIGIGMAGFHICQAGIGIGRAGIGIGRAGIGIGQAGIGIGQAGISICRAGISIISQHSLLHYSISIIQASKKIICQKLAFIKNNVLPYVFKTLTYIFNPQTNTPNIMIPPKYPCTQAELDAISNTGWDSYIRHILGFSSYRGYYDEPYGIAKKAETNAAAQLPDAQARYANVEVYRVQLTHLADSCLGNWQSLKRFMSTAYPADELKGRLEEAGSMRYEKARNYNWDELKALNISGSNFIIAHNTELSAGNNMLLSFPVAYNTNITAFNTKYSAFIAEEEAAYNATEAKVIAFNNVYTDLINMFKDGQEIFKNQEGIRREFTFDTVLGLISSPSAAGIRGTVTSSGNSLPIFNAEAMVLSTSFTTLSNAQGKYELSPMPSGKYDVRFVAPGYHDKVINMFDVLIGTISTLNVELDPL